MRKYINYTHFNIKNCVFAHVVFCVFCVMLKTVIISPSTARLLVFVMEKLYFVFHFPCIDND